MSELRVVPVEEPGICPRSEYKDERHEWAHATPLPLSTRTTYICECSRCGLFRIGGGQRDPRLVHFRLEDAT